MMEVNGTTSHINVNMIKSLLAEISPFHKRFYAFLCNDTTSKENLYQLTKTLNSNYTGNGFHEILDGTMPYYTDFGFSVLLIDFSCSNAMSFWKKLDLEMMINIKLLLINIGNDEKFYINLKLRKDVGSVNEIYLIENMESDQVDVLRVYKKEFTNKVMVENYAIWNQTSLKVISTESNSITKDRYNVNRATIRICIVIPTPDTINHLTDRVDPHIDTNTKQSFGITRELLYFLNAKPNFTFVTTWGYFNKTSKNWTGMIKKLIDKDVDIGGTNIFVTSNRVSLIHYAYKSSKTTTGFLFQSPRLSLTDNLFLLPFSTITWICAIFLIPILATVLTIVCQQGFTKSINSISGRILMSFSLFTMMLIYVSYAASIVVVLQSPSKRINTLKDLLESKMELGVEDTPYSRIYFPMQTERYKRGIYERKVINPDGTKNFLKIENGIKKVKNGLFAVHGELGIAYKFVSKAFTQSEKCRIRTIGYLDMQPPPAFIFLASGHCIAIFLFFLEILYFRSRKRNLFKKRRPNKIEDIQIEPDMEITELE
uniref:CSON011045 protein n=1 Tax=Culicoides sonorensis TaxID=179676 RepID=A0A336M2Z1_CULSO